MSLLERPNLYNKELKKINRFCNSNATPGHLDAFSSMIEKSAIMIQVAAMIDENPRTKPINSQTRILFSKPLSYPESPLCKDIEINGMRLRVCIPGSTYQVDGIDHDEADCAQNST